MDWKEQSQRVGIGAELGSDLGQVIDYVKSEVGQGTEYDNGLVRVVLSNRGCYYQFVDMPEEFSGAIGSAFKSDFVGSRQAIDLIDRTYRMVSQADESNTREISLLVIYERDAMFNSQGIYLYQQISRKQEKVGPSIAGNYQPGTLPLFFKLKVDSDLAIPVLGNDKGILFFVAHLTDQHLLVEIPYSEARIADLSQAPNSRMIH